MLRRIDIRDTVRESQYSTTSEDSHENNNEFVIEHSSAIGAIGCGNNVGRTSGDTARADCIAHTPGGNTVRTDRVSHAANRHITGANSNARTAEAGQLVALRYIGDRFHIRYHVVEHQHASYCRRVSVSNVEFHLEHGNQQPEHIEPVRE